MAAITAVFEMKRAGFRSQRTEDRGQIKNKRTPLPRLKVRGFVIDNSAASCSPTWVPMQYHRRRRALAVIFRVSLGCESRSRESGHTLVCRSSMQRRLADQGRAPAGVKNGCDNCRVRNETGGFQKPEVRGQKTEKDKSRKSNPLTSIEVRGFVIENSAASYSPTQLPMQYHRRRRA